MPKRVIDFDAMWGSDKLAACAEWAQAEYAWLYGLADASGCFELTNLRVIWGRVAAIRRNLSIERLEQIFGEFQDKGLLFAWEHEGKRYGHWTGSDVPGRLPPPSWRMRLERLAPPVPKQALAAYVARYARGRAGLSGGGFFSEGRREETHGTFGSVGLSGGGRHGAENLKFEISDLKRSENGLRVGNSELEQRENGLSSEISELKRGESGLSFGNSELKLGEMSRGSRGGENTGSMRPGGGDPLRRGGARREAQFVISESMGSGGDGVRRLAGGEMDGYEAGREEMRSDVKEDGAIECGMRGRSSDRSDRLSGVKATVEAGQAQDWNWNGDLKWEGNRDRKAGAGSSAMDVELERAEMPGGRKHPCEAVSGLNLNSSSDLNSKSIAASASVSGSRSNDGSSSDRGSIGEMRSNSEVRPNSGLTSGNAPATTGINRRQIDESRSAIERFGINRSGACGQDETDGAHRAGRSAAAYASQGFRRRDKEEIVAGELLVGRGPVCGPVRIKPEALERIRRRNAAREGPGSG